MVTARGAADLPPCDGVLDQRRHPADHRRLEDRIAAGAAARLAPRGAGRQQNTVALGRQPSHLGHGAHVHAVGVGGVDAADRAASTSSSSTSSPKRLRIRAPIGRRRSRRGSSGSSAARALPPPAEAGGCGRGASDVGGDAEHEAHRGSGAGGLQAGCQIAAPPGAGEVSVVAEADARGRAALAQGTRRQERVGALVDRGAARRTATCAILPPRRSSASSTVDAAAVGQQAVSEGVRRGQPG